MSDKAARLVFPGFKFGLDDPALAETLVDLGAGGFCLYGGSIPEVAEFTARLQARARRPLLFCADYEDGVASQTPGGTPLPSNMGLGAAADSALARRKGEITGAEAAALGVRWVLAPVVDLATEPSSPIVNVRAFGDRPEPATHLARAYIAGLKSQGVLSCIKHFPGHGETNKDSHLELPTVKVGKAVLSKRELVPYRDLFETADAVMTAHLRVPALDKKLPISLSRSAVSTLLRRDLGFDGLVSTDALSMQAIAGKWGDLEAAELAVLAGSDVILVPQEPKGFLYAWLRRASADPALAGAVKVAGARLDRALAAVGSVGVPAPELVGCARHLKAAEALAERCLAWGGPAPAPMPGKLAYLEADAEDPADWSAGPFLDELRALGGEVEPFSAAKPPRTLVVGCFVRPRAYSGRISYEGSAISRIKKALARAPGGAVVSFGNPFVLKSFPKSPGLCAFAGDALAQRAAARALLGRIPVKGVMPVRWT